MHGEIVRIYDLIIVSFLAMSDSYPIPKTNTHICIYAQLVNSEKLGVNTRYRN